MYVVDAILLYHSHRCQPACYSDAKAERGPCQSVTRSRQALITVVLTVGPLLTLRLGVDMTGIRFTVTSMKPTVVPVSTLRITNTYTNRSLTIGRDQLHRA